MDGWGNCFGEKSQIELKLLGVSDFQRFSYMYFELQDIRFFFFAGVIADMSLDIVENVNRFKIKHMPEKSLRVRVGNHTGSCCAGNIYFFISIS